MKYRIVGKYKNNELVYKVQENPFFGFPLFWRTVTYWGADAPHPDLAIPGCCTVNCIFDNSEDAEKCLNGLIKEKGITQKQFIAWLEKQRKQKHTPKYKLGDTIYYNSFGEVKSMVVSNVVIDSTDNPMYEDKEGNAVFEKDLMEQNPAWNKEDLPEFESYLCLMFQKFRTKGVCTNGEIVDFVKEHSQKLKDTLCRVWGEEDEKQARQIERIVHNDGCSKKLQEQIANWFKALKYRVQPQPKQEWSEEDKTNASYICAALDCYYRLREDRNNTNGQEGLDKARNWLYNRLKFLKPQNCSVTDEELAQAKKDAYNDALDKIEYHSGEPTFDDGWSAAIEYSKKRNTMSQSRWKPSEEQIETLEAWLRDNRYKGDARYCYPIFDSLYEQLKKLREE